MPFCQRCGAPIKVDTKYCPNCGYGPIRNPDDPPRMCKCKPCKGTGRVPGSVIDNMVITWVTCRKCNGTGKVPCPR